MNELIVTLDTQKNYLTHATINSLHLKTEIQWKQVTVQFLEKQRELEMILRWFPGDLMNFQEE